jgi:hypothetical protein
MAGFTTPDAIRAAFAAEKSQFVQYRKVSGNPAASISYFSWWSGTSGTPGVGANPTAGKANGALCTRLTAGAPVFQNAPAGETWWLATVSCFGTNSCTNPMLFDRIAHVQLAGDEASGAIVGMDATSRLEAAGTGIDDGCMLFGEVLTTLPAGQNTYTFDIVDSDGNAVTTPVISTGVSAIAHGSAFATWFSVPLPSQSRGVRSVTAMTKTGGSATGGVYNLVLARPLLMLPTLAGASAQTFRDLTQVGPGLVKIWNDTCFMVAGSSFGSFATTCSFELGLVAAS